MPKPPANSFRELPNLDFIRTIAVLSVVAVHTMVYTGYIEYVGWTGAIGVGIFFVHTTIVLMMSLERDPHVWRFYVRRAFRLFPLWWAVLTLYVLFRIPISPDDSGLFVYHAPAGLAWLWQYLLLFDFKGTGGASVVCASWSLPLEAQMYVVLPLLFWCAIRWRRLWPLLAIDLAAIAFDLFRFKMQVTNLPMAFPYFVPGVMAYLLYKRTTPKLPAWTFVPWIALLVTLGHWHGNYREEWLFCLLLGLTLPFFRELSWNPLLRICHLIARYSYGIYLCHGIAIAVGVYELRGQNLAVRIFAYLATLVGLSVGFYHWLEKPMILWGSRLAKKIERGPAPRMNERELSLEAAP